MWNGVTGVLTAPSTSWTVSDADREGVELCEALWMLPIVVINTEVQKAELNVESLCYS